MIECPHQPPCPGCPRLGAGGIAPAAHTQLVRLAQENGLPPPPVAEGAPLGWRRRARLAVRGRVHSPKIGLFAPGSHDIVDIPRCGVHHPAINRVAAALKQALRETRTAPYRDNAYAGLVRYLQVVVERENDRVQVVVVCNAPSAKTFAPAARRVQELLGDALHSLWWNGNEARTNTILGPAWTHLCGEPIVRERIGGVEVHFPPGAFGQANLDLADRLAARVGDWCMAASEPGAEPPSVADLYAGCGALGLPLLARGARVHFGERGADSLRGLASGLAARPAEERARARVHPGDVARLPELARLLAECGAVIVDPPRRGLGPDLLAALTATPPARLAYVSCSLPALLHEARSLAAGPLRLVGLEGYALFPHSDHVETLALFERR